MARLSLNRLWPALFCLLAVVPKARAQDTTMPGLYVPEWQDDHDRSKDEPPPQFRFISYFFTRASFTNAVGDPSGLKGVSLGPLGEPGGSLVGTNAGSAGYFEQRWIPVIEFSPHFVDGYATVRAQFRINYIWGLAANTVQGNQGGGFNAEQINIQTKNINIALYPTRDPDDLTIVLGTQPAYDSPLDPTRSGLNDLTRTGYKLSFLGSDATGISIYSQRGGGATKLSWLPLGAAQPDLATTGDPRLKFVWLATLDHQHEIAPGTSIGGSIWYLRDDTQGAADAYQGLVRSGPASGGLSAYTGTAPFQIDNPSGWVGWLGLNAHHNIDFRTGRFAADGFLMYNGGDFTSNNPNTVLNKSVSVSGLTGDLELLYNWGHSINDVLSFETIDSTGDANLNDNHYNSAFTLNYYGLPGAVFFTHRTLLLFPFTSTVVNYSGAITDVSNQGEGLRSAIGAATYDLVPNKLNLKVGMAYARAQNTPPTYPGSATPRGKYIGTEVNAELTWTIRFLMIAGLHAGYLFTGDWFAGQTSRIKQDPFAIFTTFTWYAF